MKKTMILLAAVAVLSSCGAKNDVEADAKEMCGCYEGAKDDSAKFDECTSKFDEMKKKYEGDDEGLRKLSRKVANCMIKM